MATPVGHYLVGLSITQAFASDERERKDGIWLALGAFCADLDVIPGLLVENLAAFHHGASHSFFAAAIFAVIALGVLQRFGGALSLRRFALLFCLYSSHVVLDYMTLDTGAPYGVPLFWPWNQESFQSPWVLLPNVQHTRAPLFSIHNLLLAIQEVLLFLPLVGLIDCIKLSRLRWPPRVWIYGCWFLIALILSLSYLSGR